MSQPRQTIDDLALTEPATGQGFAARLREETNLVHREAERTGFIADLIRGRATRMGYALFLRNLMPVYATLEGAVAGHCDSALLQAFAAPGLARRQSLRGDLQRIAGPDWQERLPLLPEADAYADAIARSCGDEARLAVHAYARYLGDLSGGQILKPILARSLDLAPDSLAFYDFPALVDQAMAKAAIRDALDGIASDGPIAARLCAEAVAAFRHNIALSRAVSAALETAG